MTARTPTRLLCLALPFAIAFGEAKDQVAPRPATFRTNARMVLVPFTVTDYNGKTIVGLQAKDFTISEDQAPQQIVSFSNEDLPCSIGLVLDISGSMQSALGAIKQASSDFVKTANPQDAFQLLTVSTQPAANDDFTTDTAALDYSIASMRPGGFTALIDTVYLGLNRMRKAPHPQRALVILSDGMDNHSRYSKSELLRVALEADVQIYSIIVNNGAPNSLGQGVPYRPSMIAKPGDQAAQRQGPNLLEELAEKTGGLSFHASNPTELRAGLAKSGEALRNQYVIGYQPAGWALSGKWHRVHVKTTVPKVHIHARTGYYAP